MRVWLGEEDSNPRKQVQSLSSYHWTIPQLFTAWSLYPKQGYVSRVNRNFTPGKRCHREKGFFNLKNAYIEESHTAQEQFIALIMPV
jgi:hypothetical protein